MTMQDARILVEQALEAARALRQSQDPQSSRWADAVERCARGLELLAKETIR